MNHSIASLSFSKLTIGKLNRKEIVIVDSACIPDAKGSFSNGETAYGLSVKGQYQLKTFLQVLEMAK